MGKNDELTGSVSVQDTAVAGGGVRVINLAPADGVVLLEKCFRREHDIEEG